MNISLIDNGIANTSNSSSNSSTGVVATRLCVGERGLSNCTTRARSLRRLLQCSPTSWSTHSPSPQLSSQPRRGRWCCSCTIPASPSCWTGNSEELVQQIATRLSFGELSELAASDALGRGAGSDLFIQGAQAAEMIEQCSPWGNLCVALGTHYSTPTLIVCVCKCSNTPVNVSMNWRPYHYCHSCPCAC